MGGQTTYGYDIINKRYVINEKEAEIVRKIYSDYASGVRSKDIKKWLWDNDVKSKRGVKFAASSIINMLSNEKYIGTLIFAGQVMEDAIPSIIDKETFDKVQQRSKQNIKRPARLKAREPYILSGKLFCAYCKGLMTADSGTNHQGVTYKYYKCSNKKHAYKKYEKSDCQKTQVSKQYIEELVIKATTELLFNDEVIKQAARQITEYAKRYLENTTLTQLEKRLTETQKQIDNFLVAIGQGIITHDTKSRMIELEAEKADLLFKIEGEKLNQVIKLTENEILFWLLQFREGREDDKAFKNRLVETFINKIVLYNDKLVIVFNIQGKDGGQLSVDEIIKDLESGDFSRFEYEQYGGQ